MGFLDKIKNKVKLGDDDLDDLDTDSAPPEADADGEDDDDGPSGRSALGGALGFLNKVKKLSSGGEDEGSGGIGGLLGKVKGIGGGKKASEDSDLDDIAEDDDELDPSDADSDDEDGEQPIRRSGIAAALDGGGEEAAAPKAEIPVPIGAGAAALNLAELFEEEFVANPTLRDLADSLDYVSAVDLAADLRTFLDELQ